MDNIVKSLAFIQNGYTDRRSGAHAYGSLSYSKAHRFQQAEQECMGNEGMLMRWVLAQVKPGSETLAKRNLERQGFESFLPLERRTQGRKGRLTDTKRPYFGNYIFVAANDASAPVTAIRSTFGVSRLVEFGGTTAHVPTALVRELKNACDEHGCLTLRPTMDAGDTVQVIRGPFFSQLGQVESFASKDRIWVLLDLLGSLNKTLLARKDVRLV
jgi:transcriptional antiterminator RfaH